MSVPIKLLTILMLSLAPIVGAEEPTIPTYEFVRGNLRTDEQPVLVFRVNETMVGRGDNLHTIFVVKAVVIKSDLDEMKCGSVFEGHFDRFYSIFEPSADHPLKVDDEVEVTITKIDGQTIVGFLKRVYSSRSPESSRTSAERILEPSRKLSQVRGLRVEASGLMDRGEIIVPSPGGTLNQAPEPTRPRSGLALSTFVGAAWLS